MYAVKQIEFDEAKNEELLDADDVVVLSDQHHVGCEQVRQRADADRFL